jgi:uncharacterized membrane protein YeaQ/YmgE (transglycosylase-associated protein family)
MKYVIVKETNVYSPEGEVIGFLTLGESVAGIPATNGTEEFVMLEDGSYIASENVIVDKPESITTELNQRTTEAKAKATYQTKIVYGLVGGAIGFGFAKYRKMSTKGLVISSLIGAAIGVATSVYRNK